MCTANFRRPILSWSLSHLFLACSLLLLACPSYANNVAVVVGNSHYDDPTIHSLQFADDDARLFAHTLITFLHYRKEDIRVLTSQPQPGEIEATAANINQAITDIANRQANATQSTFLFFASAHGVETDQGAMLAAKDYDSKQPLRGAQAQLTSAHLTQRLSALKSGLVVALLDICRKDGLTRADNPNNINTKFTLPSGKAKRVATLFSSTEGPSFESVKQGDIDYGHGFFTYYVCQGLSIKQSETDMIPIVGAMDESVSGVTLKSLHEYVRWNLFERTQNYSGGVYADTKPNGNAINNETMKIYFGQLPELVCNELAKQTALITYVPGKYRPAISPENRYATFRADALEWYSKKEYAKAGFQFSRAFSVKPTMQAAYAAGISYFQVKNLTEAEKWLRETIKIDPKNLAAMDSLGILLTIRLKLDEAEKWLRETIKIDPKNLTAMTGLGELFIIQRNLDEAEKWLREAIAISPKDISAINALSGVLYLKGRRDAAAKLLQEAMLSAPKDASTMNNLASSLYKLGETEEAEKWYRKAITTDPTDYAAMYNLSNLLQDQGKKEEAEKWLRKSIETNPEHTLAMYNLAVLLEDQGKKEEAEKWYREVIKYNPNDYMSMNNLGTLLYDQGRKEEAEKWFREIIKTRPNNALAMNNLGVLLTDQDKKEEAEKWCRNATQLSPNNGRYHANLALVLLSLNRKEEALMEAKKAQQLGLKNHSVFEKLGLT